MQQSNGWLRRPRGGFVDLREAARAMPGVRWRGPRHLRGESWTKKPWPRTSLSSTPSSRGMLSNCGTLLLKHERIEEADELFENMTSAHSSNSDSYDIMAKECFKGGGGGGRAEAIDVFHRSDTKPCAMDVGRCENLIGRLSEDGMVFGAEKLFDEMPTSRKGEWTTLSAMLARWRLMREGGLKEDDWTECIVCWKR